MRKLLIYTALAISAMARAQTKQPVTVTDMLKIKTVGTVSLSRDASRVAFTVMAIEPDGDSKTDYKYTTQIWMAPTDGAAPPRQMTSAKENAYQAAFSPDGKQIAFTRTTDGKAQIFVLWLDGGEAVQLTKFKYGASAPKWSPDGKQILFAANISLNDLLKDSILNPGKQLPA